MTTTVAPLRAFHGDPAIKAKYQSRVEDHQRLDQLAQGVTWSPEESRGCAVGCTLHKYSHNAYEREMGIPESLAYLEDDLFESMAVKHAKAWPAKFLNAIPVGADLSLVAEQLLLWSITDALTDTTMPSELSTPLTVSVTLIERSLAGDEPTDAEWKANEDALWDARARARAWARAWAWAWAWARAGDRATALRYSEKLLELLAAAPVPAVSAAP